MNENHASEVSRGDRFAFGDNWTSFLRVLDERRIASAVKALQHSLGTDRLDGIRFIDVGSGSGLSSLAAYRLGASVLSFDYDPASVACTRELKARFADDDERWEVQSGSVLDTDYLATLGQFDLVYSWGVLHHTGDMWSALANVETLVADGGRLLIALYNDQGGQSNRWRKLKKGYNATPAALKNAYAVIVMGPRELKFLVIETLRGRPLAYFRHIREYANSSQRGMSYWHDLIDWIGGYPFEVATPDAIFSHFQGRGFLLDHLYTVGGGLACNEFVFARNSPQAGRT